MFLMALLCIVFKNIMYVNLPRLFSVDFYAYLSRNNYTFSAASLGRLWNILYGKQPLQLCFTELLKTGVALNHEMLSDYFAKIYFLFFSDPVRVLSIGRNSIQILLIRSDPVRVLSIRFDPVRSWFCKRSVADRLSRMLWLFDARSGTGYISRRNSKGQWKVKNITIAADGT